MNVKTHLGIYALKVTKRAGPLFLHRKTDCNARLKINNPAVDTFDRSKVSADSATFKMKLDNYNRLNPGMVRPEASG